jgi:hypothetical protein
MFPSGTGPGPAGSPDTIISPPPTPPSGSMQYPQMPTTLVAIPGQMVPNDALIPPTQEQYHRHMQMQHAQQ